MKRHLILMVLGCTRFGFGFSQGNVGIGTTAPAAPLHINSSASEILRLQGNTPSVGFFNTSGVYKGFVWQGPNDNMSIGTAVGNLNGQLQFYTNTNLNMVIDPTTNVGIGTSSPAYKLTVQNSGYGLVHTDGTVGVGTYIGLNGGWLGTRTNHPLYFFTNDGTAQVALLQNGNVGIGTTNPTYKLSVNGNVRSKEVVVETGWADHVFGEKHKLLPLEKVESFIKANKHLPGILTAKEIQENGLNMGAMQTKMMEKIEELTLYLIDVNKQLQEARKEIDALKAKLAETER